MEKVFADSRKKMKEVEQMVLIKSRFLVVEQIYPNVYVCEVVFC